MHINMMKKQNIIAIIPARGGSKGIRLKNIQNVNGLPLIAYTINAAKESKCFSQIVCATDSKEIAEIALHYGAEVPYLRGKQNSHDKSKTESVIFEFIDYLSKKGEKFDVLVTLQPTSPLRTGLTIRKMVKRFIEENWDSALTISAVHESPVLMRSLEQNNQVSKIVQLKSNVRRQDFPKFYRVNGAIYINKAESITPNLVLNENKYGYILNEFESIDIDDYNDLAWVNNLIKFSQTCKNL